MLQCIDEKDPQGTTKPVLSLAEAIRAAYSGRARQEDIAAAAGVDQASISRYVRGKSVPNIDVLRAIETASGRPAGWIAVQAGYVAEPVTVPDAIAMDPALTDELRASLLAGYWAAVDAAQVALRDAQDDV